MEDKQELVRTSRQMWQDYLFLTREMARFLEEESMDLVLELMNQREQLQKQLETVKTEEYHRSPEGEQVLGEIRKINQQMTFRLRGNINKAKQQQKIDSAYDGISFDFAPSRVEWKS